MRFPKPPMKKFSIALPEYVHEWIVCRHAELGYADATDLVRSVIISKFNKDRAGELEDRGHAEFWTWFEGRSTHMTFDDLSSTKQRKILMVYDALFADPGLAVVIETLDAYEWSTAKTIADFLYPEGTDAS
jgi:hypothetical protein